MKWNKDRVAVLGMAVSVAVIPQLVELYVAMER
jgi:hypothetical protein